MTRFRLGRSSDNIHISAYSFIDSVASLAAMPSIASLQFWMGSFILIYSAVAKIVSQRISTHRKTYSEYASPFVHIE